MAAVLSRFGGTTIRGRALATTRSPGTNEADQRRFFFTVDLLGRLFNAEARARSVATCLRGDRLLDFFFQQLRPNTTGLHERAFPWLSPCGKELNFVAADDTPIVFHDLVDAQLAYGGTLREPFRPEHLRLSARSGRLYHALTAHRRLAAPAGAAPALMLVRSQLVLSALEHRITPAAGQPAPEPGARARHSGLEFEWGGRRYPILATDE